MKPNTLGAVQVLLPLFPREMQAEIGKLYLDRYLTAQRPR